ncbi:MAG TPA: adenine deaminase C-terminal domain-containing protein, partial [Bacteroidales bacterium]|nr:adenine deaminase C-terminal domain-containing protein [Bacteroidales bacterium]
ELINRPEIHYLAEMMNFPGVLARDEEIMQKIQHSKNAGKPIDGHAPGLTGQALKHYASAGITTDHECCTIEEAKEKIDQGMKILIREGSAARNFDSLIPLMATNPTSLMFCSDDKHSDDLVIGHINLLVKKAIGLGYEIFDVLRSATLIPKIHYGLNNGLLQRGDPADIVVVDNLQDFNVRETYIDGVKVAVQGKTLLESVKDDAPNRFYCKPVESSQLKVKAQEGKIRVIEVVEGQLFTKATVAAPTLENGMVMPDTARDILKLVALNRYGESKPAVAFIKGFGLKDGALATTVAHDSHNILAVGTNDDDITTAINLLIENNGGIVTVNDHQQWLLPLPVAGIMTQNDGYHSAEMYKSVEMAAKRLGTSLKAPFMTLSFMALLVIPELKLSDLGLFDVSSFSLVPLFSR